LYLRPSRWASRSRKLREAESRYRVMGRLYQEGAAIILAERLAIQSELLEADARVMEMIAALILQDEEDALAWEIRREARRE
jgi:hypothetical protein